MKRPAREQTIVLLIAAVQFINILDFVMVMPLGTFFSQSLGIPMSRIGLVGGAYTAAAAVAGFIGSFFLDRFDRRKALAVAIFGLVAGTAAGGFARGLLSLMCARVVAGLFGGPATSLSYSIVADVIPPERRGKAMSVVMAAFSVAQVLGVPLGLWLANTAGWFVPFFAVAALGCVIASAAIVLLPPMTLHLQQGGVPLPFASLFERSIVPASYTMTATAMLAGFLIVPNVPGFLVNNLGLPKQELGWYYGIAGATTIFTIRLMGKLVDRFGSFRMGSLGAVLVALVLYVGFVAQLPIPIIAFFVAFMTAMSIRNVSTNTMTSKVPRPMERARFTSLQSTVGHVASAAGAMGSSALLTALPDGKLVGMERAASIAMGLSLLLPLLLWRVESMLTAERSPVAAAAADAA